MCVIVCVCVCVCVCVRVFLSVHMEVQERLLSTIIAVRLHPLITLEIMKFIKASQEENESTIENNIKIPRSMMCY